MPVSRGDDRLAEIGIGRYGFFRCGGCGRALTVRKPTGVGLVKYACTARELLSRPCPAATSISVHKLDPPVWWWIQSTIEDPSRADAWIPVDHQPQADEMTLRALKGAEETVSGLEARAAGMLDNLSLLTGAVARTAAARLNDLNAELEAATARRDKLTSDCRNLRDEKGRVSVG